MNPELFNFKSHQQKGGEHAKSVAHKDHWLYEEVHLHEEWNKEAEAVSNEHPNIDLLGVLVLVVDDVTNNLLLSNVAVGLLNDFENQIGQIIGAETEVGLAPNVTT